MKLKIGKKREQPDSTQNLKVLIKKSVLAGPPGAKRGTGASSNMTDFRSCEVQNGRRKCLSLIKNVMWSPKKKRSSPNFEGFSGQNQVISNKQKKGLRALRAGFSVSFPWASSHANGPSAGLWSHGSPPEAHGTWHGPPKVHGPRGHCPPCPPSRRPCVQVMEYYLASQKTFYFNNLNKVLQCERCGSSSSF